MTRQRLALALCACAVAGLVVPEAAAAHGLSVRQDVPIPTWLFAWGATLVLIVSFVALAVLWPRARLQEERWRPLPRALSRAIANPFVDIACGAFGVFLFGLVIYAGLAGTDAISDNFTPTFVYIIFWLLPLPLSLAFGDLFRAVNPWLAIGRAVRWAASVFSRGALPAALEYPRWLGRWPAVVGILAFAWLEIAALGGSRPETIAIAALIYSSITFIAMALYGVDVWIDRAEAFGVYFNLISRLSVFERRGNQIGVRPLLSGLPSWPVLPGSVAFVCALIGTVSFDGFSAGPTWNESVVSPLQDFFQSLGFGAVRAVEATFGLGLLAAVLLTYLFFRLGIAGARSVSTRFTSRELASSFVHSLAPIALVYAAAHYVSFLVLQGQAMIALASDPLGRGDDLFGTADTAVNYSLLGAQAFWYIQVGLVVLGHVAALVLAHDRAVAIYPDARSATRSQYWMLAVMVGFTSLALWLLSEASKG